MSQVLDTHRLDNGLVILGEPMAAVESVAFGLMIPAGAACFPDGCSGIGSTIADWIFRGAGARNSRQLSDALDGLGLHRNCAVGTMFLTLGGVLEASNLAEALALYADIAGSPHLQDDQFELAKRLAMEDIRSLDDEPRQKVMIQLREQFFPHPLGRSTVGNIAELETVDAAHARSLVHERFDVSNALFSVAGKYDFDKVCFQIEELLGGRPQVPPLNVELGETGMRYTHVPTEGAQVHIGLIAPTVLPNDAHYYAMRVAVSILSGGMSSRLFTEVREKRGLCYAVGARYHGLKQAAGILCYAGTTPDKAQETTDVIIDQFNQLNRDLTEEELDRAKVGLKAALVMQSESSSSRAASIAGDYYIYGRVRSLDEIKQGIDAVTIDSVVAFLSAHALSDLTAVTIGPKPITL